MLNILVVEDSDIDFLRVSRILDALDHHVDRAFNGEEGLEFLEDIIYDLVLMDVDMPLMDGYQALAIIQRDRNIHQIPVSMLTSRKTTGDKEKSKRLGAVDHLEKPVIKEKLLKLLSQIENKRIE